MTRALSLIAFVTGMALIFLMARMVAADDRLTLLVMVLIVAAYSVGGVELWRYQRQTEGLRLALAELSGASPAPAEPPSLNEWLSLVPEALRHAVHQRIVGHFQGLPAPILTPYLVGLLVMLGLMGTFVGMVATLGGAVQALEGGTELTAIRQGLAAPIQGLGMAFGTSVAGIAASAMLGLIATLSQRDRLQVSKTLDHHRDGYFRDHSLSHQRTQTYGALQQQASALPDAVASLTALSEQLARVGENLAAWSEQSSEQLLAQQREFETAVRADFQALTASLGTELKDNLADTGKETAATLQPFVGQLLEQASQQLASEAAARRAVDEALHSSLRDEQQQDLEARRVAESKWQSAVSEHIENLVAELGKQLTEIQALETQRLNESGAQISQLQTSLGERIQSLTGDISQSVATMESAAQQSTRIGSELISTLRSSAERSLERDNALLEERSSLLQQNQALIANFKDLGEAQQNSLEMIAAQLKAHVERQSSATADNLGELMTQSAAQITQVSDSLSQKMATSLESNEQHWQQLSSKLGGDLEHLLARNGDSLEQLATNLSDQLGASGQQIASTAINLASVSASFAESVTAFKASSEAVNTSLNTISDVLVTSGSRSDEQMGYYVDQAREIIDHNLITQQTILERLEAVTAALPVETDRS